MEGSKRSASAQEYRLFHQEANYDGTTDKTHYCTCTAVENGEGSLDKEASHDDLMDAFRMSLMFWH